MKHFLGFLFVTLASIGCGGSAGPHDATVVGRWNDAAMTLLLTFNADGSGSYAGTGPGSNTCAITWNTSTGDGVIEVDDSCVVPPNAGARCFYDYHLGTSSSGVADLALSLH